MNKQKSASSRYQNSHPAQKDEASDHWAVGTIMFRFFSCVNGTDINHRLSRFKSKDAPDKDDESHCDQNPPAVIHTFIFL